MVSPPDEHGYVSFGTTVDYTRGTADYCDIIIAQVNKYMPRTFGNSLEISPVLLSATSRYRK